ncbi:helix-turn-helix domain-containing protein [Streptomyces sp. NPDC059917]|uniref:helix-turn-helix domain-containing protein n=1 Tax=Streptomyces sp. NPDC059917 TaxID=3347002 RepID=UPI0036503F20
MTTSRTLFMPSGRVAVQHSLPAPGERRRLREMWGLTPQQVADAFGVRVATVRSWESGRSAPTGKRREAYRRFLQGLAQRADLQPVAVSLPASRSHDDSAVRPSADRPEAVVPEAAAEPGAAVTWEPLAAGGVEAPVPPEPGEAPQAGWVRGVAAAVVVVGAWALVLVLLGAYVPGWTG